MLNYGRVRNLKGKIDYKLIYKKLIKDRIYTEANEISAHIFYLSVMKEELKNESASIMEMFRKGTKEKNFIAYTEKNSDRNDAEVRDLWQRATIKSLIYDAGFVTKNILTVHTNKILDKIIEKHDV